VDAVGARPGAQVLVAREGNTARQVLDLVEQPVHSVIVAIVDHVEPG
jgi:microcompartment protein CcmK/EutM